MIGAIWRWLHPYDPEFEALAEQRRRLLTEAKMQATLVKMQTRELRRETGTEHQKMHAELGPINDLLARMDKRRND